MQVSQFVSLKIQWFQKLSGWVSALKKKGRGELKQKYDSWHFITDNLFLICAYVIYLSLLWDIQGKNYPYCFRAKETVLFVSPFSCNQGGSIEVGNREYFQVRRVETRVANSSNIYKLCSYLVKYNMNFGNDYETLKTFSMTCSSGHEFIRSPQKCHMTDFYRTP